MKNKPRIRAGRADEVNANSGEWAFVDLGFAQSNKSCGLLWGTQCEYPVGCTNLTFAQLTDELKGKVNSGGPLNLLLEAPLSVAFSEDGNPSGRTIEKRGLQSRYWFVERAGQSGSQAIQRFISHQKVVRPRQT